MNSSSKPQYPQHRYYTCTNCGGFNVEARIWIPLNDIEADWPRNIPFVELESGNIYCNDCDTHTDAARNYSNDIASNVKLYVAKKELEGEPYSVPSYISKLLDNTKI